MNAEDWFFGGIIVLFLVLVLGLAFCGVEYLAFSRHDYVTGEIVALSWTPASSGTGIGYATGAKGGGVAIVSTHTPEKFSALVRMPSGDIETTSVPKNEFPTMAKGDGVVVDQKIGKITGFCYSRTAREVEK